jgi:hypothetical protein
MERTALLLALPLMAALSAPAGAAAQCGARDAIVAILAERYGETRQAVGLAQNTVMEVYASAETGSWTIAVTDTAGKMCLVAAGQQYEAVAEELPAKGSRT